MLHIFRRLFVVLLLVVIGAHNAFGSEAANNEDENQVDILGEVQNHYVWSFAPFGELELPRILLYKGHLYFYSSTEEAAESDVFTLNGHDLVPADGGHVTLDLSISTHLIFFWLSALITFLIFIPLARRYKEGIGKETEPKGIFHNLFEVFFVFIRDDVAKANIGEKHYRKFVPYLATAFFLITFMNLMGLIPWGTAATADVSVTASLALLTFVFTQWNASKDHWKEVFWFPGVPTWVRFILMPIEFVGLFTKPFALAIRLFANMLSGEILIFSIIGMIFLFGNMFGPLAGYGSSVIWIAFTVFIFVIKAFVSLLQAYIFVMLSALFIGMAMEEHEHAVEHAS